MDWQDHGVILSARKHGETSVIIDAFSEGHGRHAGVVRGGISRKMAPTLQPGNQVTLDWRARLEEHLGSYRIELVQSRGVLLSDRGGLSVSCSGMAPRSGMVSASSSLGAGTVSTVCIFGRVAAGLSSGSSSQSSSPQSS